MKRRIFLYTLGGALLTRPRVALTQQIATPKRIAILSLNRRDADPLVAVVDGLKSLGFEEGKNLTVDERGIGRRPEELMSVAAQLAQSKLDAIYSSGPKASGTARSWHTAQARWKRFGRWAESPAIYWQAPPLRIFRSSNRLHSGSRLTWGSHAHSAFRCPQRCSLVPTR